jgi:hypothetical protein
MAAVVNRRVSAATLVALIALAATSRVDAAGQSQAAGPAAAPLVVILDSADPYRIYDKSTVVAGRTNADVLSDLLADLPIRRHAETISPEWQRDSEIAAMRPALVLVHYSGFNPQGDAGPRERLKLLLSNLAPTSTRVLVYSRAHATDLLEAVNPLMASVFAAYPGFRDRFLVFGLDDHGPPRWVGTQTAVELKRVVRTMLALP